MGSFFALAETSSSSEAWLTVRLRPTRQASRSRPRNKRRGISLTSANSTRMSSGSTMCRPSGSWILPTSTSSRCSSIFPGTSRFVSWIRRTAARKCPRRCAGRYTRADGTRQFLPTAWAMKSRRTWCGGAGRRRSQISSTSWRRKRSELTRNAFALTAIFLPRNSCTRRPSISIASTSTSTRNRRSETTWPACRCKPMPNR